MTFDPYHNWLGIPPVEQPPNLYRLLGITLYEADPEVIELAADQRMSHLRTFQAGPHTLLSQALLNETAAARLCLLNASAKARYDAELLRQLSRYIPPVQTTSYPVAASPEAVAHFISTRKPCSIKSRLTFGGIMAGLALCSLFALFVLQYRGEPATGGSPLPTAVSERIVTLAEPADRPSPSKANRPLANRERGARSRGELQSVVSTNNQTTELAQADGPPPAEASRSQTTASEKPVAERLQADTPEATEARLPVPSDEAQRESVALIKDVYKADYDKAKNPAAKLELAKKLLQEGINTEGDATGKFVLLRIARDVAIQIGDATLAAQVVDAIAKTYKINVTEMKVEAVTKISKSVSTAAAQKDLVGVLEQLADLAAENEDFSAAQQFAGLAINVSRNAKDASLLKRSVARSKEFDQNAAAFAETKRALAKLDEQPTDPAANLIVGKFRCFNKGDWENGLPLLALSSDPALKGLAEQEASPPTKPTQQVTLGDGWWALAEKETGPVRSQIQQRAMYWYQQALPTLSGLAKAKLEKRIAEVSPGARPAATASAPPKEIDALKNVDPARHAIMGKWLKNKRNEITCVKTDGGPKIILPVSIKGDFDLTLEFTRINGDAVAVVFPVGQGRCQMWLDFDGFGGLTTTENIDPRYNSTRTPNRLQSGKRYKLQISVSAPKGAEATISAKLNDAPFLEWKGDPQDVGISTAWKWPDEVSFGLGTHQDAVFHSVRIQPRDGRNAAVPKG